MGVKLSRRSDIEDFRVLKTLSEVNTRVAQGEDIIRLEAGQPCFGAPPPVTSFIGDLLKRDPVLGYTSAIGMDSLRARIARHYGEEYDLDVDMRNVALSVGSSGAFILSFLAAFESGDKIGIITPAYAAYRNILKSLDLVPIEIETSAATNYQPTADILAPFADKLDGLIINSPANPTGTMIDENELSKIGQWCLEHNIRLVSDEAYHRITYTGKGMTALKYNPEAIVTNTFSKYFAMTGWRLGWMVLPDNLAIRIKRLAENLMVAPPTIAQHAAMEAFNHFDILDGYVSQYRQNRDIIIKGLPEAGISDISACNGAFYAYADISNLTNDSEEFCRRMIDEAGVAATSGVDFDSKNGHRTIRISYAGTPEHMQEACNRLKKWLA